MAITLSPKSELLQIASSLLMDEILTPKVVHTNPKK